MSNQIKVWHPGMTAEETKDLAYWERNMLALLHAVPMMNMIVPGTSEPAAGWYRHPRDPGDVALEEETVEFYSGEDGATEYHSSKDEYWKDPTYSFYGWSRVISFFGGAVTFHVPDDFDLGHLKEIQPNWDGHSTEEKWLRVMQLCGCQLPEGE